jgi:ribonuclease III
MKNILASFKNKALLDTALTHRSALNENLSPSTENNERLEFLGDAVLELATTDYLFKKYPKEQEGILTAFRSSLVKTETLAQISLEIGLGKTLHMSKGEENTGGRENVGILADSFEALLGAVYLDRGFKAVEDILEKHLFPKFAEIKKNKLYRDSKSSLQEVVQAKGFNAPSYKVVSASGPDHDKKFTVQVLVDGKSMGKGDGKNKQSAQQAAAREALEKYQAK